MDIEPSSKAEITERKIAKRIAEAGIRLRFDRVALRFLDGVKAAFDQTLPIDQSLAFTVTAPIKLPAKTSAALQERLRQLPTQGLSTTINGNGIRARMVIRVLAAIAAAAPVRLMKRDLLFVVERLAGLVDERRLEIVVRQRGIKREKDSDSIAKLFAAYLRRAEESLLGSVLVELTILLASAHQQTTQVLKDAAAFYKVDTDAIAAKVKQEFAAKEKAKTTKKAAPKLPAKQQAKTAKKSAAA